MTHYLDIYLLPDPEFPSPILMNALCGKLHRILVEVAEHSVGISFPAVRHEQRSLGGHLRLHGTAERLTVLMAQRWLTGIQDYVCLGDLLIAPQTAKHRVVRRVQPKTNVDRLRRRYAKRHNVRWEEACERVPASVERRVNLPFLRLRSRSTGQTFCLFVEHSLPGDTPVPGMFNSFGLSASATIPWF
ncbi:MAG: type I-F CRISPR-associated endoribonuclease Cas6/Csy4 [Nitrococcus mobilis]|nr:type I-F CRISPR-associated endoribonuclease Cas6/Csy4 [Nitrococcus mobilis]